VPRSKARTIGSVICLFHAAAVFGTVWDSVLPPAKETVNQKLAVDVRLEKMQTVFSLLNTVDSASVIYVRSDAPDNGNGTSWEKAYRNVQQGIDAAAEHNGGWVWVAQGTYHEILDLKSGAILMGGFRGDEIDASDRNTAHYQTTLVGNGKDHVVFMHHKTMIDGFTLTHGSGGADDAGGGIMSADWLAVIAHNVIIDNHVGWAGGGIYIDGLATRVTGHSPILYGNLILHNSAKCGDGASIRRSMALFANNTVINHPRRGFEVVTEKGNEPTVVNSIIWNNGDDVYNQFDSEGVIHGMAIVQYDCFTRPDEGEEGVGVMYSDPLFADSTEGDFSLRPLSPCIDNGLPTGPKDPDETPADLGAFFFARHQEANGVSVTFQSSPAGGMSIQVDGQWYSMPRTLSLAPGSKHVLLPVLVRQTGSRTRYRFIFWNHGGVREQTYTVPQYASSVTAVYAPEYYLKIANDTANPAPSGEGWYRKGSGVILTADSLVDVSPGKRVVFSAWTGSVASIQPGMKLVVDGPVDEIVHYSVQYQLQVQVDPSGEKDASVSIQPNRSWYSAGDSVILQAVAGAGLRFVEWGGDTVMQQNPVRLCMNKARHLTAVFQKRGNPPGVFDLVSPRSDTVIQFTKPVRFIWNRAADLDTSDQARYHFYIGVSPQPQDNPVFQIQTGKDTVLILSDTDLGSGVYYWGVRAFNVKGGMTWCRAPFRIDILSSVQDGAVLAPMEPGLEQNHPNPFNAETQIAFLTDVGGMVHLSVYELSGKLARRLWDGPGDGGKHTVFWDGKDENGRHMPSGAYLIRMKQRDRAYTRKVVFLK
jgi:hypothetical protein